MKVWCLQLYCQLLYDYFLSYIYSLYSAENMLEINISEKQEKTVICSE